MVLPLGTGFSADAPGSPLSPFGPLGSWPARKSLASSEPSPHLARGDGVPPDLRPGDGVPLDLGRGDSVVLELPSADAVPRQSRGIRRPGKGNAVGHQTDVVPAEVDTNPAAIVAPSVSGWRVPTLKNAGGLGRFRSSKLFAQPCTRTRCRHRTQARQAALETPRSARCCFPRANEQGRRLPATGQDPGTVAHAALLVS
jgi:hypothetical protein